MGDLDTWCYPNYDNGHYHLWIDILTQRRQARSEATAASLLNATERVLRRREFANASLADIAREAQVTTGAIYSSFNGKGDLLRALELSVYSAVEEEARQILEDAPRAMPAFLRHVMNGVAEVYRTRRGGLRSLAIAARDDAALGARSAEVNGRIVEAFVRAVQDRLGSVSRKLAQRAGTCFLVATSALRDRIVFEVIWPLNGKQSEDELCKELATMLCAYLSAERRRIK